jgi:hypothetical protein
MNMGTKTGAKKAYLADIEPMKRLPTMTTPMNPSISRVSGRLARASARPPLMASISPRPEWAK